MSAEDDLIAQVFAPIAGPGGLGLLDDAGLLSIPPGCEVVTTVDALVAGVHFFADDPPGSIAVKALGVNLSDLAAKAAAPLGFLLAVALPTRCDTAWVEAFAAALGASAARSGCPLIGGDTVATPGPLTLSITAFGTVETGTMLRRTGAQAGDAIYVSGTIGDGALGLAVRRLDHRLGPPPPWVAGLAPGAQAFLRDRYLHPQPRLALGPALRFAQAGMDVSDGLVGDLRKMLRVSGVSGRVQCGDVPLSEAARAAWSADPGLRRTILTGGDDYEVLATVPPRQTGLFETAAAAAGVAVTRIGEVLEGIEPAVFLDEDGAPLDVVQGAYSHR